MLVSYTIHNHEVIMTYANTVFPEPANIYVNIGAYSNRQIYNNGLDLRAP